MTAASVSNETWVRPSMADVEGAVDALLSVGAHFVKLRGDLSKAPVGKGWQQFENRLKSRAEIVELWETYAQRREAVGLREAAPTLGIVPASVGVFVVDVDALGPSDDAGRKAALTAAEERAARVAWSSAFGRCRADEVADPSSEQRTLSGALHLLYRVERPSALPATLPVKWHLTPRTLPSLTGLEVDKGEHAEVKALALCGGDMLYTGRQAVVYDLSAWLDAAMVDEGDYDDDEKQNPKVVRLPDRVERLEYVLRRYYEASKLATIDAGGERHNVMLAGVMRSVGANAMSSPASFELAAHLNGWSSEPGENALRQIDDAWRGAVEKSGAPDESKWQQGFSKRQQSKGAVSTEESCVLSHDAEKRNRNDAANELLQGRIRVFNGSFYQLDSNMIWSNIGLALLSVKSAIASDLTDAGVCRRCLAPSTGLVDAVYRRVRDAANVVRDWQPYTTLNIDGEQHVVEPHADAVLRLGVANLSPTKDVTPVVQDHHAIHQAFNDIGVEDAELLARESQLEGVMREYLGARDCCLVWVMRWFRRSLTESQKTTLMILADSNSGKSTLIDVFSEIFAQTLVLQFGGGSMSQFNMEHVQSARLVFVDEAQSMDGKTWSFVKSRTGGARDVARAMGKAGSPTRSFANFVFVCERKAMDFGINGGELMHDGWVRNRLRVLLAPGASRLPESRRNELLQPSNIAHFAWRLLAASPAPVDDADSGCEHMRASRDHLRLMFLNKQTRLEVLPDNRLKPPPSAWSQISDDQVSGTVVERNALTGATRTLVGGKVVHQSEPVDGTEVSAPSAASNASAGCGDCGHCEWCTAEPLAW